MTTATIPAMASMPAPPGGDYNRAGEMYAFTWIMVIASITIVAARMYSRIKLTKNVWWDDWFICVALLIDFAVAIMWSVYAERGYARHMYYLDRSQLTHAGELNAISRSLCVLSIGVGKISVAFLIERFAGPSKWRKWLLRFISISIAVSAIITVILFYIQCQPVRAVWDKSLIKAGTGKCWDPIPLNTWNLVIASYWAFLDFALAIIPVDIIWKLQLSTKKKVGLSLLLSMGILIEMNVIIIAASIPTLRPLFLVLLGRPAGSQYRSGASSRRRYSQYLRTSGSNQPGNPASHISGVVANKAFDSTTELHTITSDRTRGNTIMVNREVRVESGESAIDGGRNVKKVEGQWGYGEKLQNVRVQEQTMAG
ncbi:MAG: hypothetical protein Q9207_007983 [Kuettlingeria erythrocarpa]